VVNTSGSTNKSLVMILVIVLISAAAFSYMLLSNPVNPTTTRIYDVPTTPILDIDDAIHINGDGEFENYTIEHSVPGNGTADSPFVIQNLSIVEEDMCIDIRNVSSSFIIRNCELNATADYWGIALYLSNCHNAIIDSCRAEGRISGIEFFDCNDILVTNCFVSASFFGINSSISQRAVIRANSVYNTTWGISMIGSNDAVVERNRMFCNELGLISQFSKNCTLMLCNITDNKLGVRLHVGCQNWVISTNRFEGNTEGNAQDDGAMNQWDDGISVGNIWDDYLGTGLYSIPGSAGSSDRFPKAPERNSP
jgi:parallel beta-helix repeat protein